MEPIKSSPEAEAMVQQFRLLAAFLAGLGVGFALAVILLK